ncbi:GTPase IMAP family member 7-like [Poeciliopsis prolifica]|uniref:GTPase IMAP family member 7-like n=1 Tax=Poeciliopsis prolifica TaxID=188132 RepID=UPI0024145B9A|nr:GTPase IMAP family member 7-like [Poeciliopsis prolifica]
MAASSRTKLVLLGKSGIGKSSLGNAILGANLFEENMSPNSVTHECKVASRDVNGASVQVIDTPGFFGNTTNEEQLKREMLKCIEMSAPEIHAFLIVLNVGRYGDQEKQVIDKIKEYFTDEALKHAVVVFTYGDQLRTGQKIEDFIEENPLKELVRKCGGRCHVVDNKYWKDQQDDYRSNRIQVGQLLNTIERMKNEQSGYTNFLLQAVGNEIARMGEGREGWPWGQILKVSAGATVGMLLGAFLGFFKCTPIPCLGAFGGALVGGIAGAGIAYSSETTMDGVVKTAKIIFKIGEKRLRVSCLLNSPNSSGEESKLKPE